MKVGLVIESFDPRRGGVEQWTCQFARHVLAEGHEVHVVASHFAPEAEAAGIVAHPIESAGGRLQFAAAAEHKLRSLALDVVHDTGCGWHCDVLQPHGGSRTAAFEQNLLLAPRWLRGWKRWSAAWLPRHREFEQLVRRQYNNPRRLYVAISRMVAGHLAAHHGVAPEQLRLVYNGVDVRRFTPEVRPRHRAAVRAELGVAEHEVLLAIVAHNFRLKGVPTLLNATAQLADEGQPVHLVVAGGKRTAGYRRWAEQLGIGGRAHFVGSVLDAVPYYAAADVYVQPTFYDPCSLVVLEALACGLPVVTSRFNGAGELITCGVEGEIVDNPADVDELVAVLRPLMDSARRAQMGAAARQLALRHPLERNCQAMLDIYREIVSHGRRAAA